MSTKITRRTAIGLLAAGVGMIGLGLTGLITLFSRGIGRGSNGGGMMDGAMMGNVSRADMNIYMEMFNRLTETSSDPEVTKAIREHAQEVSGFVRDGMPAMMRGMMGG